MPVIRITDATWDRLKRWAIPLEDSPEDAVRKVLDAAEEQLKYTRQSEPESIIKPKKRSNNGRLPRGQKTPQSAYYQPILEAIYELGGSGSVDEVLEIVEKKMKDLNAHTIEQAEKIILGTARSMGIEVK